MIHTYINENSIFGTQLNKILGHQINRSYKNSYKKNHKRSVALFHPFLSLRHYHILGWEGSKRKPDQRREREALVFRGAHFAVPCRACSISTSCIVQTRRSHPTSDIRIPPRIHTCLQKEWRGERAVFLLADRVGIVRRFILM